MRTRSPYLALSLAVAACGGGSTAEEIITCQTPGTCTLALISGDDQTAEVGAFLDEALVVEVSHSSGLPPRPVNVRWSVVSGGGTVTTSVAQSGVEEMFRASTRALLGAAAGTQVFRATLDEDPAVTLDITATALPGPPREMELVSGNGQTAEVATTLPEPFVVRVLAAFGNPVPDVRVGWSRTVGDGDIEFDQISTDAMGETSAVATLGPEAGVDNNLFVAEAPMIRGALVRFIASALPGPAQTIEVLDGNSQAGLREGVLPAPLRVQVKDAFENPVPGETVKFSALTEGASVSPAQPRTDETGTASAAASLGAVGGEYRFRAELTGRGFVEFTASAFPPLCTDDDWCWVAPVPQGNTVNDSFSVAPDDVWVVGDYGTILRWQGLTWEAYATGTINDLRGVYGSGPDDVWAVGDNGTILRFDGARWRVIDSGTLVPLNDVWGTSATDVYAVGDGGLILRYDGQRWVQQQRVTDERLNGIWAAGPNAIFVGADRGVAVIYDGMRWRAQTSPIDQDLNAVWGTAPDNVWFVGDRETFLRWQGQVFQTFPSNSTLAMRGVWGKSDSEVFAVGDRGRVRRFDGNTWRPEVSRTPNGLRSVTGIGEGVLAVGEGGVFIRRPADEWQLETSRRLNTLQAVWGTAPDALWAVGIFGTVLSWNGSVWSEVDIGINTSDIIGLHGSAADDVWAVGEDGLALRYTGDEARGWSIVRTGTEETLNAVHVFSSTIAWAVGDRAAIRRWDGSEWVEVMAPPSVFGRLNSVWGSAPNDVWAVGDAGVILRYDGSSWTQQTSPTGNALIGVRGRAANDVYAMGFGGTLLRFDGTSWAPIVVNTTEILFSMHFSSATDAWLVGTGGVILRNQGAGWVPQESGTNNSLNGVFGAAVDDVWVVGESGAILRWNPQP